MPGLQIQLLHSITLSGLHRKWQRASSSPNGLKSSFPYQLRCESEWAKSPQHIFSSMVLKGKLQKASEQSQQKRKLGWNSLLLKIPPEKISSVPILPCPCCTAVPTLLIWFPRVNFVIWEANEIAFYLKLGFIFKGLF